MPKTKRTTAAKTETPNPVGEPQMLERPNSIEEAFQEIEKMDEGQRDSTYLASIHWMTIFERSHPGFMSSVSEVIHRIASSEYGLPAKSKSRYVQLWIDDLPEEMQSLVGGAIANALIKPVKK